MPCSTRPKAGAVEEPQIEGERSGLLPDLAFSNTAPVDVTEDFFPFGEIPKVGDAFFSAARKSLPKPDATVRLSVQVISTYVRLGIFERRRRVDTLPLSEP